MSTPRLRSARQAVIPLLRLVLAVQAAQILVAVISGVAASTQHLPGADFGVSPPRESGAQRLLDFAGAGDGLGALLMLLATVLLWLVAMLPRRDRSWVGDYAATCWLLVLTGISAALAAAGYLWVAAEADFFPAQQEVRFVGSSIVSMVAMAGALIVARYINAAVTEPAPVEEDDDDAGAAVFAVDRKTGAVMAWATRAEARDNAPLYGVEDDEYEWFLDDGTVLHATARGREVSFTPTGEERPDELLRHLKEHALRRGIALDGEDADEPLAYVDPIARDHYLEMWPGWLRWLGRLAR